MDVQINMWAVLLATVASMVVGSVWYAKPVFGKTWAKLAKLDDKQMQKGAGKAMLQAVVAGFLTAYVLAHVAYLSNSLFQDSFMQNAVQTAFWLWLGISATTIVTHNAFELKTTQTDAVGGWQSIGDIIGHGRHYRLAQTVLAVCI